MHRQELNAAPLAHNTWSYCNDFPGRSVAVYHQHTLWTPLPNQLPSILDIQSELLPC